MLRWRVLISFLLIPLVAGAFYADALLGEAAPVLLVLSVLVSLRAVWELRELFRQRVHRVSLPLISICTAGTVVAAWIPHLSGGGQFATAASLACVGVAHSLSVLTLLAAAAWRYRSPGGNLETLAAELLVVSYAGLLMALLVQLRWVAGAAAGYVVLGSLLVCTKGGDIGAYTAGRLLGRTKLAPLLSPAKTWEGAIGGIAAAGVCGMVWLGLVPPLVDSAWRPAPLTSSLTYGMAIGIVGIVGDLCESLLKRDVGQKDSAALFPGFGGVLDILDSVIYSGPVALLLWKLLPLATWE